MAEPDPKIAELEARLDSLVRTQIDFQVEITAIRKELTRLRNISVPSPPPVQQRAAETAKLPRSPIREEPVRETEPLQHEPPPTLALGPQPDRIKSPFEAYTDNAKADIERFIGENLISKIGIIVLLIGIGVGTKYAIDNNLISPLTRITLGYLFGIGLLIVGARLKTKYLKFSAVLTSGGLATMYFITYFAYSAYGLIPQLVAFAIMALLTVATVGAALLYSRQVIAHIGLVGAYAVPFLVSDNSGRYAALFTYMAIVNTGILAIAVWKVWKPIFYTASGFTWLIFAVWLGTKYDPGTYFYLALIFLGIFFATFYTTKLVHGVVHIEPDDQENLASMIVTTILFFTFSMVLGNVSASVLDYAIYFTFIAVFALLILISSYRFYGRVLVFAVYPLTWLAFAAWFFKWYSAESHFMLAAIVASFFFAIFYGVTLAYRLATDELGMAENAGLVLTNSFIFYGFGYALLDSREALRPFEGLFTAAHAALHSITAQAVSRLKPSAVDVVQTLTVLIITFVTIAIPIQFDGNVVTVVWSVEAAVLFYFGRMRGLRLFEHISYPVMMLAAGSMVLDWLLVYQDRFVQPPVIENLRRPFANGDMVTGLVFVAAAAFITMINRDEKGQPAINADNVKAVGYLVAGVGLVALYNVFRIEIGNYFHCQAALTGRGASQLYSIDASPHSDLRAFDVMFQIDYTLLFLSIVGFINLAKARSLVLGASNVAISVISLASTATIGMLFLYGLRISYLNAAATGLFGTTLSNVAVRYVTFALIALLVAVLFRYSRDDLTEPLTPREWRITAFDGLLYSLILIVSSCELMNIAAHLGIPDADRFGLSILWGMIAFVMVFVGIIRKKKYLRIASIFLLAVTLIKLFFYDITELGTIPKTILFVSLGLLLLVISFLYNKYKIAIFGPAASDETEENL
nr:hypothetical protein [uncultured bacterium]